MREADEVGVSCLLELVGPSCMACGEVLSIDMLSHAPGEGCCLFGHGDHLGTCLGETAMDGCSSAGDVLAGGADGDDKGDHPNKTW